MGDWIDLTLRDVIVNIADGGTPSRHDASNFGDEVNWVIITDIKDEIFDTKEKLSKKGFNKCSSLLWKPDSIILSTGATIGEVGITRVHTATKQGICGIEVNESLVKSEYLKYWFQSNKRRIISLAQGSTIKEVRPATIIKIPIRLPVSVTEQSTIARILTTIDQAIEKTEQLIAKYEHIKTGLMQDLLTRGIDEQGRIRSEETHVFKDSVLGRVPVEWEQVALGDCSFVTKLAGFEFTNYFKYIEDGEIIALRALNIKHEKLDLSDIQRISRKVSHSLTRSKLYAGDILITYIGAYIGDILQIREDDKYHLAPNIAKIVPSEKIANDFLEIYLRSYQVQVQMKNSTATTATPSLTMRQIRNLKIAFPKDKNEQIRIVDELGKLNIYLSNCKQSLGNYKNLKTALMQDLLTGRVRVDGLMNH